MSVNLSSQRLTTLSMLASVAESMDDGEIKHVDVSSNLLPELTFQIATFRYIEYLNASNNELSNISADIRHLTFLRVLDLRNNKLDATSLPYEFSELSKLEELNLSGNIFTEIPLPILKISSLVSLYLGGNLIEKISLEIDRLSNLRILYLGGNLLESIPEQLSNLPRLEVLSLSANRIRYLPASFGRLQRLRTLMLNDNMLQCLPFDITRLRLEELSLRNNPLLVKFVSDYHQEVPSLQELSARCIKAANIEYVKMLPPCLVDFLDSGKRCVNPRCHGVYFCSRVSNVKFIDLCGKYQVPMLQYLCSPRCTRSRPSSPGPSSDTIINDVATTPQSLPSDDNPAAPDVDVKLRRVLLG